MQTIVPTPCLSDIKLCVESYGYTDNHQGYADCTCNDKSWTASSGIDKVARYTWWGQKRWIHHMTGRVVCLGQGVHDYNSEMWPWPRNTIIFRLKDRQLSDYMIFQQGQGWNQDGAK